MLKKLNPTCQRTLVEGALSLCMSRTNYNVEIEHWLVKLLETSNTDLERLFKHYDVQMNKVQRELAKALEQLKTGNARPPSFSPNIVDWMRESWLLASI